MQQRIAIGVLAALLAQIGASSPNAITSSVLDVGGNNANKTAYTATTANEELKSSPPISTELSGYAGVRTFTSYVKNKFQHDGGLLMSVVHVAPFPLTHVAGPNVIATELAITASGTTAQETQPLN